MVTIVDVESDVRGNNSKFTLLSIIVAVAVVVVAVVIVTYFGPNRCHLLTFSFCPLSFLLPLFVF